jgi:hypothetical protein
MLVEARVVCEKARNPEVHRLMHGWQDPRIPAWSYTIMRFPLDAPRWISRASVGASPHGSYRVAAEICEAIEMEKGRP